MNIYDIFTLANIAGALVAIAVLLAFVVHYLSKRDGKHGHGGGR